MEDLNLDLSVDVQEVRYLGNKQSWFGFFFKFLLPAAERSLSGVN